MICNKCNRNPAMDGHHCFFHTRKGKRASKAIKDFVDNPLNIQMLCRDCHTHHGGKENREHFMKYQISKHGRSAMIEWLDSAPDKIKIGDRWKSVRRLADYANVNRGWQYGKTGGKE